MRLKYSNTMYLDDVAVDFPDMNIGCRAPVLSRGRRKAGGRPAQAQCLYRPVGLVAEIFSAKFGALCQHHAEDEDATAATGR